MRIMLFIGLGFALVGLLSCVTPASELPTCDTIAAVQVADYEARGWMLAEVQDLGDAQVAAFVEPNKMLLDTWVVKLNWAVTSLADAKLTELGFARVEDCRVSRPPRAAPTLRDGVVDDAPTATFWVNHAELLQPGRGAKDE